MPDERDTGLLKIDFRLHDIERRLSDIESEVRRIESDVSAVKLMAEKWKGGFIVVIAIGGIVAWLSSIGGSIVKLFK